MNMSFFERSGTGGLNVDFIGLGVGLLVGAAVLAFIVLRINSKYGSLFSNENIVNMSSRLGALKQEANNNVLEASNVVEVSPVNLVTDTGMPLTYTVSKAGSQFAHHFAISFGNTYVAHSAAITIASWVAYCLDIPSEKITVPVQAGDGAGRVRHILFSLSEHEQQVYLQKSVRVVTTAEIQSLWKTVMQAREAIMANSLPPRS